ncbi:unnamed protein product [Phytophthora fragariaefolia]|uniref:Unnamed protein product n=1 Tax=Phytophthora fragariaefolia TaxID=1490495 RepID=A0A9W6Y060_9STRA|nr:unnamed protein product [Phytophthora fragariaefolia]
MFAALSRDFFWPRMYKGIRKWVRSCEICQRVKPAASKQDPLRPLPIATSEWRSAWTSSSAFQVAPMAALGFSSSSNVSARWSILLQTQQKCDESAELFLDLMFRHHGLLESIVSDRDPRFTSAFWTRLFALLDTRLLMSTADHPEADGQTERVNRVLEDVLRSYATSFTSWSFFLPMAEFALNNAPHASKGLIPFFVNNARHPSVPELLAVRSPHAVPGPTLGGGGRAPTSQSVQESSEPPLPQSAMSSAQDTIIEDHVLHDVAYEEPLAVDAAMPAASVVAQRTLAPKPTPTPIDSADVSELLLHRQAVTLFVHDALQVAVDCQKANADRRGRKNMSSFRRGERVLLSTDIIQGTAVTNLGANKLAPRFIGPFKFLKAVEEAYTLDIPPHAAAPDELRRAPQALCSCDDPYAGG